ncbi:MAG TPA: hypothetical protein VFV51_09155 [Vicinamibacterales bacterium]|nr:hypothetical protein [Vicinamibacterales bacterium]
MDISPTTIGRFIIATGAAAGWLMTGSVTQDAPGVRESQSSVARPIAEDPIPPAQFTEVLRDRMRETVLPERGRNPFTYGSRVVPRRDAMPSIAEPAMAAAMPVEPPPPVFKLSGIAASQQDGTTVLTAIVIDNGTMVFAKAGDRLSNGYSVLSVDEMSMTLVDAAGVTQTLRLP